jgi:hypothetical protein
MIASDRFRCAEHVRDAARQLDAGAIEVAAELLRVALLLMWDRQSIRVGDKLLTVTASSRERWLEERAR